MGLQARFRAELAGRGIAAVSGALVTVLLARLLDPSEYGVLFLAISVLSFVTLFSKLGVAKSAARYVSEYKETDPGQVPTILTFSLGVTAVLIAVVTAVLFLTHERIAILFEEPELSSFLLVGTLFVAFGTLFTYARLVLQGFEDNHSSALIFAVDRGSKLLLSVGIVAAGYGAIGAFWGYVLGHVFASVLGLFILYRSYYSPSVGGRSVEAGLRRRIVEYSIPLTATDTADVLDKQVDTILVGFFLHPAAVSYYVISKNVLTFVETPMAALGFTLSPTYAAEKASGGVDRAARLYEEALVYALLAYVPAAIGLFLVADPAVTLVFGDGYAGAIPVLQAFSLLAIFQAVSTITNNGLDYLGRAKGRAITKLLTAIANVGLNLLLIPTVGVVGAAVATVITYGAYVTINVYLIHVELGLRPEYLLGKTVKILLVSGVMAIAVLATASMISGFVSLLAVVLVGLAVWMGSSVATGLITAEDLANVV